MKKTQFEMDFFYYEAWLELLGGFSLSKQLTMNDLGKTAEDKAMIQKCYRDIKRDDFKGTVIDYLCLVSRKYLSYKLIQTVVEKENVLADAKKYAEDYPLIKRDVKLSESMGIVFLMVCRDNRCHMKNMLRLFNRRPDLIIENNIGNYAMARLFELFSLMMVYNLHEFLSEKLVNPFDEPKLWEQIFPLAVETLIIWNNFLKKNKPTDDNDFTKLFKS